MGGTCPGPLAGASPEGALPPLMGGPPAGLLGAFTTLLGRMFLTGVAVVGRKAPPWGRWIPAGCLWVDPIGVLWVPPGCFGGDLTALAPAALARAAAFVSVPGGWRALTGGSLKISNVIWMLPW